MRHLSWIAAAAVLCLALITPAQVFAEASAETTVATVGLRRAISAADIANATLAGGVAIGSTCGVSNLNGIPGLLGGLAALAHDLAGQPTEA